jgi:hypothetical protein
MHTCEVGDCQPYWNGEVLTSPLELAHAEPLEQVMLGTVNGSLSI